MESRTAVLLGAGASADAGLPLTASLAEQIVDRANSANRHVTPQNSVRALNFVYGSMMAYQAEVGMTPLLPVNIERLISALRLLQSVGTHEAAPFVASWEKGAVGAYTSHVDADLGAQALRWIMRGAADPDRYAEQNILATLTTIARAANRTDDSIAFSSAEQHVLKLLMDLLSEIDSTSYLEPIAELARRQVGGVDIVSLNYDLCIEMMADKAQIAVDRGIDRWKPGLPLTFSYTTARINLMKVHGSVDWVLEEGESKTDPPRVVQRSPNEHSLGHHIARLQSPWIVVGEREKLSTAGPILPLIHSAETALYRATHLLAIGYSFSDAHINALIRDWLHGNDSRTLTIIDPSWGGNKLSAFQRAVFRRYGTISPMGKEPQVNALKRTAKDYLETFLPMTLRPTLRFATRNTVNFSNPYVAEISITWKGPTLYDVAVHLLDAQSGRSFEESGVSLFTSEAELDHFRSEVETLRTTDMLEMNYWPENATIQFYTSALEGVHPVIEIWARWSEDGDVCRVEIDLTEALRREKSGG